MRALGPLLCLLALAPGAHAQSLAHVLAKGETLEAVARATYGDARFAPALAAANGLGADAPAVGRELRLPSAAVVRVTGSETWSSLARDYWGAEDLGPELAALLGRDAANPAPAGESLRIPALIAWKVRRGDTLVSMSRAVYGSPDRADAIARLNGVRDARRLHVGRVLRVPFPALARGAAAEDVSAPPPERVESLRQAVNAYLDGRFDEALEALQALRTPILAGGNDAEREQLFRHLLFTYVAFERSDEACAAYRVLRETGAADFDVDLVSPKILRAVAACQ